MAALFDFGTDGTDGTDLVSDDSPDFYPDGDLTIAAFMVPAVDGGTDRPMICSCHSDSHSNINATNIGIYFFSTWTGSIWNLEWFHEHGVGENETNFLEATGLSGTTPGCHHFALLKDSSAKTYEMFVDCVSLGTAQAYTNEFESSDTTKRLRANGIPSGGSSLVQQTSQTKSELVFDKSLWTVNDLKNHMNGGCQGVSYKTPLASFPLHGNNFGQDISGRGHTLSTVGGGPVNADHAPVSPFMFDVPEAYQVAAAAAGFTPKTTWVM